MIRLQNQVLVKAAVEICYAYCKLTGVRRFLSGNQCGVIDPPLVLELMTLSSPMAVEDIERGQYVRDAQLSL